MIRASVLRRGLTLLELVVVLAILAALTTVAAVATDNVISQGRFDLTQKTLENVRRSVIGPDGTDAAASSEALAGFVADTGRLPLAVGSDPSTQLAELWSNPAGLEPFGIKTSPSDPEVSLTCGWRGPYLRLPVGSESLVDGWGNPFEVMTFDGSEFIDAADGLPIYGIGSLGADGAVGSLGLDGPPLSEDLSLAFIDPVNLQSHWTNDVVITVRQRDASGDLVAPQGEGTLYVAMYTPNPTTGGLAQVSATPSVTPMTIPYTATFGDVPVGPKVVRAYQSLTEGGTRKSLPLTIQVTRQGQSQWDLILPPMAASEPESEEVTP
jgi:prepilin-type N-terminal cleavage/methylation domain-containing protein